MRNFHGEAGAGQHHHRTRAAYFLLPDGDPAKADPNKFPTIFYNQDKKRWEDRATNTHYDDNVDGWRQNDTVGGMMSFYKASDQTITTNNLRGPPSVRKVGPSGIEGWENYLRTHDMIPPGMPS